MFLMHARWLKSDRFFTDDFRPETYTEFGIEHVVSTGLFESPSPEGEGFCAPRRLKPTKARRAR